jgi:hypothetical protein
VEAGGGNGKKWYGSSNVIRVLFYAVFMGLVGWGTYVFTVASTANDKADVALTDGKIHDVQIKGHDLRLTGIELAVKEHCAEQKADLKEIEKLQREILIRLPK